MLRFAQCCIIFLFTSFVPAFCAEWKPVTPADLQLKTPLVDKNADAEAIFWEVRLLDEIQGEELQTTRNHYIRMKIFTERGREYAKVELSAAKKMFIGGIAGRTIKPDGRIVDMKRDAIFETDIAKGKGLKVRGTTFTLPDVQPGDIIEYQWRQSESGAATQYVKLPLQRDIPVQTVRYRLKPLQIPGYGMKAWSFHIQQSPFQHEANGFTLMEFHNMPAFKEEPDMVPEDELRAWVLIYYANDGERKPDSYWPGVGKKQYGLYQKDIKVNGDAKKTAADAIAGAKTDEEKVNAIYAWVHKNIRNIFYDVTADERRAAKENKSSADTLKQGLGTGFDINMLFAALVDAAGLEARIALTGDRSEGFFNKTLMDTYFLRGEMVAVKVGGAWKYYDPATPWLASGFQSWEQQGVAALITDGKTPEWSISPLSKPSDSSETHSGQFKLDDDGTLSGTVKFIYTGHLAASERRLMLHKNAGEREQRLIEELKQQFGNPEISEVKWDGVEDIEKPVSVTFKLQLPAYMQRTGKRIFVQPAVFQHNLAARFPNSERKYPVYFHYPWSENDDITIDVPAGYEFDHPDLPAHIKVGNTVEWNMTAQIQGGSKLIFKRTFQFGGDGNIILPKEAYSSLKQVFDAVHNGDEHALALKQAAAK